MEQQRSAAHRAHLSPARPHRVFPRLSDDERDLVVKAAAEAGLTLAGFVAKAAIAASTALGGPSTASGDLRELQRELFAARRAVNMFGSNVNQVAAAGHSTGQLPVWAADAPMVGRSLSNAARYLAEGEGPDSLVRTMEGRHDWRTIWTAIAEVLADYPGIVEQRSPEQAKADAEARTVRVDDLIPQAEQALAAKT